MTLEQLRTALSNEMQLQLQSLRTELCQDLAQLLDVHHVEKLGGQGSSAPTSPFENEVASAASEDNSVEVIDEVGKFSARSSQRSQRNSALSGPQQLLEVPGADKRGLLEDFEAESAVDTLGSREIMLPEHEAATFRGTLFRWLNSNAFNYTVSLLVFMNAILIGAQTDFAAQNGGASDLPWCGVINHAFCLIFTAEVCLKLFVYGGAHFFWRDGDWKWNCFDTLVVLLQWADYAAEMMPGKLVQSGNLGMCLRMLRLARIMRLARVIHLMVELRSMVASIIACLRPLIWASVLFGMLVYTVAVTLTESANHYRASNPVHESTALDLYFSSLGTAAITLWMCITGGIDWKNVADPLINEISPLMGAAVTLYVAFSVLAMMNVITGIFVENASAFSKEDKDNYVVRHVLSLFKKSHLNEKDELTLPEFQRMLETKELRELFQAVDVDVNDAESLFRLLDMDETGTLSPQELVDGWFRLRGPAKALDLAVLMADNNQMSSKLDLICEMMNRAPADVPQGPRRMLKGGRATSIAIRLKNSLQTMSRPHHRRHSLNLGRDRAMWPRTLPL